MPSHVSFDDEVDSLAAYYRGRLDQAEKLNANGGDRKAKDVCLELRLKCDIGVFSRARLNLLLAVIHEYGNYANTYAYECLDLLDILRQDEGGVSRQDDRVMSQMEEAAKDVIDRSENARMSKNMTEEIVAEKQTQESPLNSSTKTDVDVLEDGETWTMTIESKERTAAQLQQMASNREKYELKIKGYLQKGRNYKPLEKHVPLSREMKPQDEAKSSPGLPPNTTIPAEAASTEIRRTARQMPQQGQGSLGPQARAMYNRLTMQAFKAQMTHEAHKYGDNPAMIPAPVKHQLQKNAQQEAMATIQRSSGYELSSETESFYTANSQMSAKLSSDSANQSVNQISSSPIGESGNKEGNNSSK